MPSSRTSSGSDNESSPENDTSLYGAEDIVDSRYEDYGHDEVITKRIGLSRSNILAEQTAGVAANSVRYLANSTGFVENPHAPYYPIKTAAGLHSSAHNTLNPATPHHQYYMENTANQQYVYRTYSYMPSYYNKQLRNYQQQQQMQLQLNHARQAPMPPAKYSFQESQSHLVNQRMPEVVSVRYLAPMKQIGSMMARGEAPRQKPAVTSTNAIQYQPGGTGERVFAVDNFGFNYPYAASTSRYNLYDGSGGMPEQRALDFDISRSQPHLQQALMAAQQHRMNFKLNDGKRKDGNKLDYDEPILASWNRQVIFIDYINLIQKILKNFTTNIVYYIFLDDWRCW